MIEAKICDRHCMRPLLNGLLPAVRLCPAGNAVKGTIPKTCRRRKGRWPTAPCRRPAKSAARAEEGGADAAPGSSRELSQLLHLAIPGLAVVLSDPLQTLVDSACIGRLSTLALAALGPNTAVFNFTFQLFSFLGVATTTTIASHSLKVEGQSAEEAAIRREAAETTLCNSLTLAAVLGTATALALRLRGGAFLAAIGTSPEVFPLATEYLSIRALAGPAVMILNVCQGACLGQQESWTPMWVCLAMTSLSLGGDIYLVWVVGLGLPGAAMATASAQYLAAGYFVWRLWRDGERRGGIPLRWKGLPRAGAMRAFFRMAAALIARTAVGMAAYFCMTVTATRLGTFPTAAHQIAMQSFWFLSFFPEPLSIAAQSLLARDKGRPAAEGAWAWLLLKSGALLGVTLAGVVGIVFTRGTWAFTSDVAIQEMVAELAPLAVLSMAICGVMVLLDGISIGAGDYNHLPPSIAAGLAATLCALELGRRQGAGLAAVWWALAAFYAARLAGHLLHYWRTRKSSVFAGGG